MPGIKANAAVCEMCGGSLTLADSGENFVCQNCGLQYPKDWVRAKVQEITGTVRIDGPVQVEGMQSADKLSDNAETFIRLQKHGEALRLFEKMQDEYPHDYRGWWGAVRIRSDEFTALSLDCVAYSEIISDGKSAIKVADSSKSSNLKSILDKYVANVYSRKVEISKADAQKNKGIAAIALNEKKAEQAEKERTRSDAECSYKAATSVLAQKEERLKKEEKTCNTTTIVLYVIAGSWALFILISMIIDWRADLWIAGVLGIILFGFVIPFGLVNFITGLIESSTKSLKKEIGNLSSDVSSKKSVYDTTDSAYRTVCNTIEKLEGDIRGYDYTITELSQAKNGEYMEEYISGKSPLSL